jgi:hypothetical protein
MSNVDRSRSRTTKTPKSDRVQTGLRLEKPLYKVLKGLADYLDITLGELVELIVLRSFEDERGFSKGTRRRIQSLREIHGHADDFAALQSRLFVEPGGKA